VVESKEGVLQGGVVEREEDGQWWSSTVEKVGSAR
jgi:hypothetical protein